MHVGDASASALATALVLGALPRLKVLTLRDPKGMSRSRMAPSAHAIGDAGLVALAPALRGRPALEMLSFMDSPLGHEGIAALVARRRRRRQALRALDLNYTQVSDAAAARPSPLRSAAAHFRRSRRSICSEPLRAPRRRPPCGRHTWRAGVEKIRVY